MQIWLAADVGVRRWLSQPWPKWIDGKTGRRSDVAHHYIYPALDKSENVHLLAGCAVKRVIIEYVLVHS